MLRVRWHGFIIGNVDHAIVECVAVDCWEKHSTLALEAPGFGMQTRTSLSLQHAPAVRPGSGTILYSSALTDCIFGQLPNRETSGLAPGSIFQALAWLTFLSSFCGIMGNWPVPERRTGMNADLNTPQPSQAGFPKDENGNRVTNPVRPTGSQPRP
jgi:hypothetical protein